MAATTTTTKPYVLAGSRKKVCCGRLVGCACHRSKLDIASASKCFGGNYSSNGNVSRFFSFRKCGQARCKIKCKDYNMLMPLNNFKGRFNQGSFPVSTDQDLNCTSQNIVYLITCKICSYQYVGETARSFAVRMREHWDKVRKGDKSQLVYAHFQSDDRHRNSRIEDMMRFQIIEKIRADDLGQDDALVRKRRLERELYWIAKLRTAFPLGLNDRIQGLGIAGNVTDRSFKDFNYFRIANLLDEKKSKRRGRRLRKEKGKIDSRDFRNFCDDLKNLHKLEVKRLESLILGKKRAYLEQGR